MPSSKSSPVALADTNVLSELIRPRPDPGVVAWLAKQHGVAVSAMTIDEMAFGFRLQPKVGFEGKFDAMLESWVDVLPVTREIARRAGALRAEHSRAGRPKSQADMLIAATALMHGMTLVTRDLSDFEGCGLVLLNPFR